MFRVKTLVLNQLFGKVSYQAMYLVKISHTQFKLVQFWVV
jgi:hypothetical protein